MDEPYVSWVPWTPSVATLKRDHLGPRNTGATVDLDKVKANIKRVGNYCSEHGLRLRPHTKTHKTPDIGRMQLDRGAVGLTVAKVGEAEVMVASGTPDLLVAYPSMESRNGGD